MFENDRVRHVSRRIFAIPAEVYRLRRRGVLPPIAQLFVLLLLAAAWAAVNLPSIPVSAQVSPQPLRPAPVLVRGYIATPVVEKTGTPITDSRLAASGRDVYLPGIYVYLRNVQTGDDNEPVATDLSGRFTLAAPTRGRYRLCWKGEGFVESCSKDAVSVANQHVFVDTVRIFPRRSAETTVVFGTVLMKDRSRARLLEPLMNVNAFARVALLDVDDKVLQEVSVNNFSEYLLPNVPVRKEIVLRATIEGATTNQRIFPEANLAGAAFHPIDLVFQNEPPRLEPLAAVDTSGRRVKTARPGSDVRLEARSSDRDGDALKFKWLLPAAAGTLSATDTRSVAWTLPAQPGRYTAGVIAYDGKGGYARSSLSLRVDELGIPFSGTVVGTDAPAVAGAQVEVNGQLAVTGTEGFFQLHVRDADRFVLNIRKPGYALVSRIYDNAVTGGHWTMTRATVVSVDPTGEIEVSDARDKRNCPGALADRLSWRNFPQLARPQWQDGKGNVVQPFRGLEVPLPGFTRGQRYGECGPGMRVRIPANALVDGDGQPPTGNVDITISTIDLMSPEQMPGDYTVRMTNGEPKVMQSYGAGTIEVTAGARTYNLRSGSSAEIVVPVDPSQLAAGGPLPSTIPLLTYREREGVWVEDGTATLQGTNYVANVTHFTAFNTDTIKTDQSCLDVQSPTLPASYRLEVTIPMGGGAAPKVITRLIDNSPPSRHVVYNLPSNVNVVLVPIDLADNTPIGTFVVNTGGPQNPTDPNLPAFPYDACATDVELVELAVPEEPLSGEFLHGLYSFSATNLTELDPFDPSDAALAAALDQSTTNYYAQIDPRGKRLTLAGFQSTNGFPSGELRGVFANSGDLGFGRDMHCKQNGADVACYVTNYGSILTPDADDVAAAVAGTNPVATVAMEYSRIESPPGEPVEFDDPERVVKFYVYNADGTQLLKAADLDGIGARPIPQLCMVCHGGEYPGGSVFGTAPPFNSREDVKLGSKFLPFDLRFYTFAPSPFDKASQQGAFKSLNEDIVKNHPPDGVIAEIIDAWYATTSTQDENVVVPGWNAQPAQQVMYRDVTARACRTCHVGNVFPPLQFDQASQAIDRLGSIETRVCVQHVMPHAKVTHSLFWTSVGPHMPAQLQVFGDNYGTGLNGWTGTLCGDFTPGGDTPETFYSGTVQPIWNSYCTGCHTGGSPPGGLSLAASVSYGNLVNVPSSELPSMDRIEPSDANNSYLWHKIHGTQVSVGGCCAQMPLGGPDLPTADPTAVSNILTWINSGAPP